MITRTSKITAGNVAKVTKDRKNFTTGLANLLDADLVGEQASEDSQLAPLKKCILVNLNDLNQLSDSGERKRSVVGI